MDISRLSIGATRDVHNVLYAPDGTAYCDVSKTHQWKTGKEWFGKRAEKGYITFGDRHLGMAVTHKVAVLPGETYQAFWTRIRDAENKGHINTIGTSAYSDKDAAILAKEAGIKADMQIMDKGALVGSRVMIDGKWVYPHGKENGGVERGKGIVTGATMLVIAVLFACGYLIMRGK